MPSEPVHRSQPRCGPSEAHGTNPGTGGMRSGIRETNPEPGPEQARDPRKRTQPTAQVSFSANPHQSSESADPAGEVQPLPPADSSRPSSPERNTLRGNAPAPARGTQAGPRPLGTGTADGTRRVFSRDETTDPIPHAGDGNRAGRLDEAILVRASRTRTWPPLTRIS
jgi:hypothetical protein